MLVAQKTHLDICSFAWLSVLLARLFVFQVLFLLFVVPISVLIMLETGLSRCSDSFERQFLLTEMIFLSSINQWRPQASRKNKVGLRLT